MHLQLQSRNVNEIIGTLGHLMGRYLHSSTWQKIAEIYVDSEFQPSLPLGHYQDVWRDEVFLNDQREVERLSEVVKNWEGLGRAFRLRHRLVHGVTSCGTDYARERVYWTLDATYEVRTVCAENDINLDARLPVRKCTKARRHPLLSS